MTPLTLLIVRHAIAADRDEFAQTGASDDLRPLTDEGRRRMRQGAKGLKHLLPRLGAIAASPLARARETAEILGEVYGLAPVRLEGLAPGGTPAALVPFLESERGLGPVTLVGHEPDLNQLASWLLAGRGAFMPFKKGGACLIEFRRAVKPGGGQLLWALSPKALRRL